MITNALICGLIISVILGLSITVTEVLWPAVYAHDYPESIQKDAQLTDLTKRQKVLAYVVTIVTYVLVVAVIALFIRNEFHKTMDFQSVFIFCWIICMFFNAFDLLILDWLIFNTITPACICLPGTIGNPEYKNYMFNLIGFFKGIIISSVIALVIAGIAYGLLLLF